MSPETAGSLLTEEKQYAILEQAWLHNQHRGTDAAGYFRTDLAERKVYVKKAPRKASDILADQADKAISPAHVFAAHTRAATVGDPADNRNNHPVQYGKVIVTHNGGISNHEAFRRDVPKKLLPDLPDVDTVAIPIALSELPGPNDLNDVADFLNDLHGGMACHAIWSDQPDTSLMFRGRSSPMVLRWNEKLSIVTYASVDEANFEMIAAMGLDPNDPDWTVRTLDEYSLFTVHEGQITNFGRFGSRAWGGVNKLGYKVSRYDSRQDEIVLETDSSTFWGADYRDRDLAAAKKAKRAELVYTKKRGFRGSWENVKFPSLTHNKVHDKVVEADRAFLNKEAKVVYAQYGDVVVIFDVDTAKLCDVHMGDSQNRWMVENKANRTQFTGFEDWKLKATTLVGDTRVVRAHTVPAFQRQVHQLPSRAPQRTNSGGGATCEVGGQRQKVSRLDPEKIEVIDIGQSVNWQNVNPMPQHEKVPMLWFNDVVCREHGNLRYSEHAHPQDCERAIMACISAFSSFEDVTLWYLFEPHVSLVTRHAKKNGSETTCKDEGGKACTWKPYLYRQVHIGDAPDGAHQVMEILVGEQCSVCHSKMFIRQLPAWLESFTGDKSYVT